MYEMYPETWPLEPKRRELSELGDHLRPRRRVRKAHVVLPNAPAASRVSSPASDQS